MDKDTACANAQLDGSAKAQPEDPVAVGSEGPSPDAECKELDAWLESRYQELADEKYKEFNARVVATVDPERMLGVRTPDLRRIAREAAKHSAAASWLNELPHYRFESMQVHAFIISSMRDYDECVRRIDQFLPFVNNWATCDQMNPRVFAKHPKETIDQALVWMESQHTYTCRFGMGVLMRHGLREHFDRKLMEAVVTLDRGDDYYVNMMRAWYIAEALAWKPEEALKIIEQHKLDRWTHNKAIQKAIDSRRVSSELKDHLRTLRRKTE